LYLITNYLSDTKIVQEHTKKPHKRETK